MKTRLITIIALAILLAGCTVNPQDLAPRTPQRAQLPQQGIGQLSQQNASQAQNATQQMTLSAAEVARHNTANDCWMIMGGKVYDLSPYTSHPGGDAYVPYCGTDGTGAYDTKAGRGSPHSSYASSLLASFELGTLGQQVATPQQGTAQLNQQPQKREGEDESREWDD